MSSLPLDLGGGLVLRRGRPADAEALAAFNARIHSDAGPDMPEERIGVWTRELLSGAHPAVQAADFTIVEDTRTGQIVSSLNLISQTWTYAGVPFGVGRPELVGTHPDYRHRGLVRRQMEVVHGWSAERGELVQAITGIPWYYRQFGYEMGMTLGGGRVGYAAHVPGLKDGEPELFRLRPAAEADLAFIAEVYAHGCQRGPLACVRDAALWRYELAGRLPGGVNARALRVIETPAGEPVGFLAYPEFLWGETQAATAFELKAGVSWLAAAPSVARYLWAAGQAHAAAEQKACTGFAFALGAEHPVYRVLAGRLPGEWKPYAWYVRVPDLPGFLRHITPALERRLANSLLSGHTGEVRVSFYRSGLLLKLAAGRLSLAPWQPRPKADGDAAFPDLTFLHLLFGHRTLDELKHLYRDCWTDGDEARLVLETLFPKQPSDLWPVH